MTRFTPTNSIYRLAIALLAIGCSITFVACQHDANHTNAQPPNNERQPDIKAYPLPINADAIENLYRVTPELFSGGQPQNDAGFAHLQKLGIKTIISVDGITPDVATAKRFGMGYVHLPVQYKGIERDDALIIAKAAKTLERPVFIHCHHGKHRGPTAVAMTAMVTEGWSKEQAQKWLTTAGTSPHYEGLYASVARLWLPSKEAFDRVPTDFPQTQKLERFTASMARIGELHEHLKSFQANNYKPLEKHPDLSPTHEALMLNEAFREANRSYQVKHLFLDEMADAVTTTKQLHTALVQFDTTKDVQHVRTANQLMIKLGQSCKVCHKWNRD